MDNNQKKARIESRVAFKSNSEFFAFKPIQNNVNNNFIQYFDANKWFTIVESNESTVAFVANDEPNILWFKELDELIKHIDFMEQNGEVAA